MYKQILAKIQEFDTIIIHTHQKPDGDAIGAQLGLKYALQANFPKKAIYAVGEQNERFGYLGSIDTISDDAYKDALVIVVDSGAKHLISDERYALGSFVIKIDHHIPQGEYGNLAFVNQNFESASGIIAHFIKTTNLALTKSAAEALFTGIVTDSGRFRYTSVSSQTFELASYLMSANIDLDKIYDNLYLEDLDTVKLRSKLTLKFQVLDTGIAYLINTYEDVVSYNSNPYNISRGMVNIMAGINQIYIWANFTECEDGKVLVELRSRGPNINKIATKYGGGGHLLASGATVESLAVVDDILKDITKTMEEFNEQNRNI
ncbi:MAG: DHH family phosphoesterase [Bacilli bacterium]